MAKQTKVSDVEFIAHGFDVVMDDLDVWIEAKQKEMGVKIARDEALGPNGLPTITVSGSYVGVRKFLDEYFGGDDPSAFEEYVKITI